MLDVAAAFLATLASLGAGGLLVARTLPHRRPFLIAWNVTIFALAFALGAMTAGYAMGFRPALLRAVELFGALIAPFALALGMVELAGRTVQARFAARLITASYVVVAVVILLLDPIIGTFGKSLPKVSGHYSSLPGMVINGAHVFAVVCLVACAAVTAVRANRRDRRAAEEMLTIALVALAGVLVVAAVRGFLPGPLAPLAMGGASALVWFGAVRVLPDDTDEPDDLEEPYDMPSRAEPPHRSGPHPERPSFAPPVPAPVPQPGPQAAGAQLPGPQAAGQYGRITIYTLREGHAAAFDRLAAEVTQAVREREPGTLVYTCHTVDNAPAQRIFYQLFRDAAAVEEHTRQPHVQRFAGEARAHVTGTNVIELTVNAAKVAGAPAPRRV